MSEAPFALRRTQEVAFRALCLGALVFRGTLDQAEAYSPGSRQHERAIANLTWWLVRQNIIPHQTEWEKSCFRKALGEMPQEMITEAVWQVESLVVLLWALGVRDDISPYDSLSPVEDILSAIPFFDVIGPFFEFASLRSDTEISRAIDLAEIWQWRAWMERSRRSGETTYQGRPITEVIGEAASLLEEEGYAIPIAGDFPVGDRPYREADSVEAARLAGISSRRYDAFLWLTGRHADWAGPGGDPFR